MSRSYPDSDYDWHGGQTPSRGVLLWASDLGLFAALFVLPFVMGGRQAIGEFSLLVIACWTTFFWLLHHALRRKQPWRITGVEPLMLAGIALCVTQTLTLTPEVLNSLSPQIGRLLPMWHPSAETTSAPELVPGSWLTISLVPAATMQSLCSVISVVMIFLVAVQRIDTIADATLLMRSFAVAATLMAVFGCGQFLLGNGQFFGFYEHPFTHTRDYAKGAFTNPNHFADYLAMSVPILLAWYAIHAASSHRRRRSPYDTGRDRLARFSGLIALGCLACVAVGILLSQSRGGLVTACVGAMVTLFLLYRQRLLTMRAAGTISGIAIAALVSLTLFGSHVESLIEANFHELVSGDSKQLDHGSARQKIWSAAAMGIARFPIMGTGLSSHREVYWTYFDHPEIEGEFSHAENGYLQLTLETGFVGLGIAALALLMVAFWCLRGLSRPASPQAAALLAAIAGVFAVNLVHSITDFVWYVPSIMTVMVLMGACAARLESQSSRDDQPTSDRASFLARFGGVVTAFGVITLGVWMAEVQLPAVAAEPYWFEYIRLVHEDAKLEEKADRERIQSRMHDVLMAAAKLDPNDCRIQMRAAADELAEYRSARQNDPMLMSLANLRDAAQASEWESPAKLEEWLANPAVLGDRTQLDDAWERTQHALSLCPLLAEGYIRLGELAWLHGANRPQEDDLLRQALIVRPYDPLVHFSAGREAWLRGKEMAALEHWRRAFDRDAKYQQLIIETLADSLPASWFLDNFELDTEALARLRDGYRDAPDQEGFQQISRLLAERLTADAQAASRRDSVRLWRQAHEAYLELNDVSGARQTAFAAVEADPNSLPARLLLGQWLYRNQEFAAAREHLEFCWQRRRQDPNLKKMLTVAGRITADSRSHRGATQTRR
ncbi:MAG: O-antigen ligase family protein [Planctomycetaceae bacterium]